MPSYEVRVTLTKTVTIPIYARDEEQAEERAVERVEGWSDVTSAEADSVEEV